MTRRRRWTLQLVISPFVPDQLTFDLLPKTSSVCCIFRCGCGNILSDTFPLLYLLILTQIVQHYSYFDAGCLSHARPCTPAHLVCRLKLSEKKHQCLTSRDCCYLKWRDENVFSATIEKTAERERERTSPSSCIRLRADKDRLLCYPVM